MKRKIMAELLAWKERVGRKPLILKGARQVGKTYILKRFGELAYEHTVYLNFETTPRYKKLFEGSLDPHTLLKALATEAETDILPGKTLIIFDEVQECPSALNSLKYFCEEAPDYHLVAAGSLLGVKLAHEKGFPVGKVQFLTLYPLTFVEFLEALSLHKIKEFIESYSNLEPLPESLHDKLLGHFKEYLFVGGMPEAVAEFATSQNLMRVREIQQAILNAYSLDFVKHAPSDHVMKITQVWDSIPGQLAKEHKKFMYSAVRPGGRAKEFEVALQWLMEAGLIYKAMLIKTPRLPLAAYADFNVFKIYLVDVGLLGAMSHLSAKTVFYDTELFTEFKGALAENYVGSALIPQGYPLFYWTSEGKAELDFIFEEEGRIYPLEVKSGTSLKKQSLRVYADTYQPELLVRSSLLNLKRDGKLLNCPLYLVGNLQKLLTYTL